jgi:hypothetical protein
VNRDDGSKLNFRAGQLIGLVWQLVHLKFAFVFFLKTMQSIFNIHHDEQYWGPDVLQYNPDRFNNNNSENNNNNNNNAYLVRLLKRIIIP